MYSTDDGSDPNSGRTAPQMMTPSRGPRWGTMIALWVIVFLFVWQWLAPNGATAPPNPVAEPRAVTPRGDLAADELATIEIFKEASPSVVYIQSSEVARDFFSLNQFEIPRGTGTGFIYDRDGHVVTNSHVIMVGDRYTVTLADQTVWDAKLVGQAQEKDLAVLKIDAPSERLKPTTLGTSNNLLVGQKVFAIGNPFGLDHTLTTGVVSALGREIQSVEGRPIQDAIQTDAAINPGNSGGPLLDSAGRLIGVNTQIATASGGNIGIGFAIPVDIVSRVVTQIIRYGRVIRPGIGVAVLPDHLAQQLGLKGVLIMDLQPGGSAAIAGLRGTTLTSGGRIRRLGDMIVKVQDKEVRTQYELLDALEQFKVGDDVRVTFIREEKPQEATVRLQGVDSR